MASGTHLRDEAPGQPADNAYLALELAAQRFAERDYVVVDAGEQRISYRGLLEHVNILADMLQERGVRRGDRVCLAMSNSVEWVVGAFAAFRLGAVIVPLNTRFVDREVQHCLTVSRPRAVLVHEMVRRRRLLDEWPSLSEAATMGTDVLVHRGGPGPWRPPPDWLAIPRIRSTLDDDPSSDGLDGAAALLFTSGTTSAPKAVILTHTGLIRLAYEVGRQQSIGPTDRFFSVAPFFHCSGLMHALLTTLLTGATLFTASRYDASACLRLLGEERITVAHGPLPSPSEAGANRDDVELPYFHRAWAGGGPDQLADMEAALGVKVCSLWGMTETGGCSALTAADDDLEIRHDSAGRPLPGLEFRIVDDGGVPLYAEEVAGELQVRGWNITPGYYGDPDATAAAVDPAGWLRTGDLAEMLPRGRFRFIGRLTDIIRVGGENLSPLEVESVLCGHDAVADAAVVPQADARLGEIPVAAIVTTPGVEIRATDLRHYCATRLADFKVPRAFHAVTRIPRTDATDRIQRHLLRAEISEGRTRHVE